MPGSLCNSPSLMSGVTPMLSRLSDLMCRQKGLVLLFSNEASTMLLMCAFFLSARCLLTADAPISAHTGAEVDFYMRSWKTM